jgi:hypothetical protein
MPGEPNFVLNDDPEVLNLARQIAHRRLGFYTG